MDLMELTVEQQGFWEDAVAFYWLCGISMERAEEFAWLDLEEEYPEVI